MEHDIDRVLIPRDRIAARVRELGQDIADDLRTEIGRDIGHGQVVLIPVLTGAIVFVADLIRELPVQLELGLVAVSSYPGRSMESKGASLRSELPPDLEGKHVLIVDDILDSGSTLSLLHRLVRERFPASVRTCVLLSKQVPRAAQVRVDYVGFEIPNEFVIGYGLDYGGHYRNLPDIAVLKPDAR